MKNFRLSRRSMVRGILGGGVLSLALPPLEAMFDTNGVAYADGTDIPKRFGVFFWGNGVKQDRWTPSTTGADWTPSPALMPLSDIRDYVSVVSGMRIRTGNERGHHAGTVGILSGSPMIPQDPGSAGYASTFSAPSIDQVVARAIGGETRFRSLEVGVTRQVVTGEGTTLRYLSHNGPDSANAPSYVPRDVFIRLFTDGFTGPDGDATVDPRLGLRRSILDAVRGDVNRLHGRLGAQDRMRLEQHLDSIRALETQIAAIESAPPPPPSCVVPGEPAVFSATEFRGISRAMNGLTAMALACDQTRVFSNMFSGSVSVAVYEGLGSDSNHHSLTHDEPGDQPIVHAITHYIMEEFAHLLATLRDVPVGDGNLLDHCAILASTDTGDGRAHTIDDYPILVAGRAGGALRSGIHHREVDANTSTVLLTLLRAMGLPLAEFGNGGGRVTSGCSALEA